MSCERPHEVGGPASGGFRRITAIGLQSASSSLLVPSNGNPTARLKSQCSKNGQAEVLQERFALQPCGQSHFRKLSTTRSLDVDMCQAGRGSARESSPRLRSHAMGDRLMRAPGTSWRSVRCARCKRGEWPRTTHCRSSSRFPYTEARTTIRHHQSPKRRPLGRNHAGGLS